MHVTVTIIYPTVMTYQHILPYIFKQELHNRILTKLATIGLFLMVILQGTCN